MQRKGNGALAMPDSGTEYLGTGAMDPRVPGSVPRQKRLTMSGDDRILDVVLKTRAIIVSPK